MVWQRSPRFASLTTPRYARGAPIGRAAFHEGCNYRRKLLFRHEPPLRKGGMKGGIVYLLAPMGSYRNARESLFTRLTRARGTEGFARIGKTTGLAGGWLFALRLPAAVFAKSYIILDERPAMWYSKQNFTAMKG